MKVSVASYLLWFTLAITCSKVRVERSHGETNDIYSFSKTQNQGTALLSVPPEKRESISVAGGDDKERSIRDVKPDAMSHIERIFNVVFEDVREKDDQSAGLPSVREPKTALSNEQFPKRANAQKYSSTKLGRGLDGTGLDKTSKHKKKKRGKNRKSTKSKRGSSEMLRHFVSFKFSENSTLANIALVIDAFRDLTEKIDLIKAFEWGYDNSPEGLQDDFTHCFLLTFRDEEDRDKFLQHTDHVTFRQLAGQYVDEEFVFDFWGMPSKCPENKQRHAVFFKFLDDAAPEDVEKIENAFLALPSLIEEIKAFEWGYNISPENLNDNLTFCALVTFHTREGRDIYIPHPDHQDFVQLLGSLGILELVRVLDFWALDVKSGKKSC